MPVPDDTKDDQVTSVGPVGDALAGNIARLRESQRLTYVQLSESLERVGRPIPVLGLRRIERRQRRVDAGDLLALAAVLGVPPVDLLVSPAAAAAEPYAITPEINAPSGAVREWIGGRWLFEPGTATELATAVAGMPQERAERLAAEWLGAAKHEGLARYIAAGRRNGSDVAAEERELREIRRKMRTFDVVVPPVLPPDLEDLDDDPDDPS
jgi:transcriptional regulator with XRE-family HTH domain